MINIIVPVTDIKENNKEDLDKLLSSISIGGYEECQIICCFDSTEEDFYLYFNEKYPFITCLINQSNRLQCTKNVNNGIRYSLSHFPDAHVILVNQDCILPRWEYLKELEGKGLATPNSVDNLNLVNERPFIRTRVTRTPFYCTFINNQVLKVVGLLDGVLKITHSDDDMCLRTQLAGFPVEIVSISIHHKGTHINCPEGWNSRSGAYTQNDLNFENAIYRTKWQVSTSIPHGEIISTVLKTHKWEESMKI